MGGGGVGIRDPDSYIYIYHISIMQRKGRKNRSVPGLHSVAGLGQCEGAENQVLSTRVV